jgi:hypothetical protein
MNNELEQAVAELLAILSGTATATRTDRPEVGERVTDLLGSDP